MGTSVVRVLVVVVLGTTLGSAVVNAERGAQGLVVEGVVIALLLAGVVVTLLLPKGRQAGATTGGPPTP